MTKKVEKKDSPIRVLLLDILKPHKPDIVEFGKSVCGERSIVAVNISVYAIDEKTESVKMTLEGNNIDFENIKRKIEDFGAVVHSIDKVILGKREVIEVPAGKSPT